METGKNEKNLDNANIIDAVRITTDAKTENKFAVPNITKITNDRLVVGDTVILPLNIKDGEPTFWETGGRKDKSVISSGVIVASQDDQLLNAVLFNKLNRRPNGKHAMMIIKPGYKLYIGKLTIRKNLFAPMIRIIKLTFLGINEELSEDTYKDITKVGNFVVEDIFTTYNNMIGIQPAERLVRKLHIKDVIKPFYANGWSMSDTVSSKYNYQDIVLNHYKNLITGRVTKTIDELNPDKFLDMVEDEIAKMSNNKLSAALQVFNFQDNVMEIKPFIGLDMKDIRGSINDSTFGTTFRIPIDKVMHCYNRSIILQSTDPNSLEIGLAHDQKYCIKTDGQREYILLRAWRG